MIIKRVITATLALPAIAAAAATPGQFRCATPEPSQEQLSESSFLAAQEAASLQENNSTSFVPIVIPTWFHVVAASTKAEDGYLSVCAQSLLIRLID